MHEFARVQRTFIALVDLHRDEDAEENLQHLSLFMKSGLARRDES